jgi:hypothetical protein
MAEPVSLDPSACHPCALHHVRPQVTYYPWRDPAYYVACPFVHHPRWHALREASATSLEAAIAQWNAQHADGDVRASDASPVDDGTDIKPCTEEEYIRRYVTPWMTTEFLATLQKAACVYGWDAECREIPDFVNWCHTIGNAIPERLMPYTFFEEHENEEDALEEHENEETTNETTLPLKRIYVQENNYSSDVIHPEEGRSNHERS